MHNFKYECKDIQNSEMHTVNVNVYPSIEHLQMHVDGCNFTTTPFDIGSNITMEIEWPETNLGDTASVPCPCAEFAGSLAGRAYRYCSGTFSQGAHWEAFDISGCEALNSMTTRRLCVAALLLAQVAISYFSAPFG